jgi:hypothetical protein
MPRSSSEPRFSLLADGTSDFAERTIAEWINEWGALSGGGLTGKKRRNNLNSVAFASLQLPKSAYRDVHISPGLLNDIRPRNPNQNLTTVDVPDLEDGSNPRPSSNNEKRYYAASVGLQSLW